MVVESRTLILSLDQKRYLGCQGCGEGAIGRDFRIAKPTRKWIWRQEASLQRDSYRCLYTVKQFGRTHLLYYVVKAEVVL
jgi:hypothetical protein